MHVILTEINKLLLPTNNGEFLKMLWRSMEDRKDETMFRFVV